LRDREGGGGRSSLIESMILIGVSNIDGFTCEHTPTGDATVRRNPKPLLVDAHHELPGVVVEEQNVDDVTANSVTNILQMLLLNLKHF
jgi:hypothetical protein